MIPSWIVAGVLLFMVAIIIATVVEYVRRVNIIQGTHRSWKDDMTPEQQERYFRQSEILGTIGIAVLIFLPIGLLLGWF